MLNTPHQNWTNFKRKVKKTSKKIQFFPINNTEK